MSDWQFAPDNPEGYEGFVYLITHKPTGKYYIGKKLFWTTIKKPPLKGKKNRRLEVKETAWRDYWGSSKELKEFIKEEGVDKFEREILFLCKSKWEMSYKEAEAQFDWGVLFDEDSFNGIINCRLGKAPKYLR